MNDQNEIKCRKYCISFGTGCNLDSLVSDDCRVCRNENYDCFFACQQSTERLIAFHSQWIDKVEKPKKIILSKLCRQMLRNGKSKDDIESALWHIAINQGKFGVKAKQAAEDTYYYISREDEFKK